MSSFAHLVRRAAGSIRNDAPGDDAVAVAAGVLTAAEFDLWCAMAGRDQRHSLVVLGRFDGLCPAATRAERAAALLHDVGKTASALGWTMRVVATVLGAFGLRPGRRFREYHDHERIGAQMLRGISDDRTIGLVGGTANDETAAALRRADDV